MTTKPLATSCHPNKKNGQDEWQNFLLNVRPLWGTSYLISQNAGVHVDADRLPELVLRSEIDGNIQKRYVKNSSETAPVWWAAAQEGSHAARQRSTRGVTRNLLTLERYHPLPCSCPHWGAAHQNSSKPGYEQSASTCSERQKLTSIFLEKNIHISSYYLFSIFSVE